MEIEIEKRKIENNNQKGRKSRKGEKRQPQREKWMLINDAVAVALQVYFFWFFLLFFQLLYYIKRRQGNVSVLVVRDIPLAGTINWLLDRRLRLDSFFRHIIIIIVMTIIIIIIIIRHRSYRVAGKSRFYQAVPLFLIWLIKCIHVLYLSIYISIYIYIFCQYFLIYSGQQTEQLSIGCRRPGGRTPEWHYKQSDRLK